MKIFLQICPCKNSSKKDDLIKITKGEQMLMYDLNIVTILKKLIEFEKIKEILFEKKQIDLMKILHTRIIDPSDPVEDSLNNKLYNINCQEKIIIEELSSAYDYCY